MVSPFGNRNITNADWRFLSRRGLRRPCRNGVSSGSWIHRGFRRWRGYVFGGRRNVGQDGRPPQRRAFLRATERAGTRPAAKWAPVGAEVSWGEAWILARSTVRHGEMIAGLLWFRPCVLAFGPIPAYHDPGQCGAVVLGTSRVHPGVRMIGASSGEMRLKSRRLQVKIFSARLFMAHCRIKAS